MSHSEWPASNYAVGSYLQAKVAEQYLHSLMLQAGDSVLDIGCGDGAFSTKILDRFPITLLGIDRSLNMLELARQRMSDYPNFSVRAGDVLTMSFNQQFDYIVSFWCLHWCSDLKCAFRNMYQALKQDGKLFIIVPAGDDSLVSSFNFIKNSGKYPCLKDFKSPIDYTEIARLAELIKTIPFKHSKAEIVQHSIILPSLDIYRKFVNGLPFFDGQVPEEEIVNLNEALVQAFALECEKLYQGRYQLNVSIYLVRAER